MIIKGGIVYDPANGIYGEEMDLFIDQGKMALQAKGDEIDARGLLVMPGGVDAHSHIAGKKVNTGRIMSPNDSRLGHSRARQSAGPRRAIPFPTAMPWATAMLAWATPPPSRQQRPS